MQILRKQFNTINPNTQKEGQQQQQYFVQQNNFIGQGNGFQGQGGFMIPGQQQQIGGIKTMAGQNTQQGAVRGVPQQQQQLQKNYNVSNLQNSQHPQMGGQQFSRSREQIPFQQQQNQQQQIPPTTNLGGSFQAQENEKLKKQINNLEFIIQVAQGFEKTQNVIDLKKFAQSYQQKISELVDELYDNKLKYEEERKKNQELEQKLLQQNKPIGSKEDGNNNQQLHSQIDELNKQNLQLKKQVESMKSEMENTQQKQANQEEFTDRKQMIDQIKNQQQTIEKLSSEVNELSQKNQEYHQNLKKRDFFKEYENNLREVDGLRKENMKVNLELKAKKDEIALIQGKQPPSQQQNNMIASMNMTKNF